jgi:hypothetical protein
MRQEKEALAACIQVLSESQRMSEREIANAILAKKLYPLGGHSPYRTVSARLCGYVRTCKLKRKRCRIKRVGPGLWELNVAQATLSSRFT